MGARDTAKLGAGKLTYAEHGASRRGVRLIAGVATAVLAVAVAYGGWWLSTAVAVGAGYAAKVSCSLALNSGLDPELVFRDYVSREIAPLSRLIDVSVSGTGATAGVLGIFDVSAVRRPGLGCTLLPAGSPDDLELSGGIARADPPVHASPWPAGSRAPVEPPSLEIAAALERAFEEPVSHEPGRIRQAKAVLFAHDGRLIAERYAPGYGPDTPMLSWSMAKSVLAALVGIAVGEGRLALHEPAAVPEWSSPGDPRSAITLDQLLRMSSGLEFDEHYGAVNDVSRMLFTKPDTAAFAARKPLAAPPDTVWSYSSGTSNIVARLLLDTFDHDLRAFFGWAHERLFRPVGITSAFFEPDASGTPIGSSFVFMTARDFARFGELHRLDGVWNGRRILPEGWVRYVTTPTPGAPQGEYGAHWWLNAGAPDDALRRTWPELPRDAYSARGHSGQYVMVVPSAKLVVVRLGLSFPDDGEDGTAELVADLLPGLSTMGD